MKFWCPHCNLTYDRDGVSVGQNAVCGACRKPFIIQGMEKPQIHHCHKCDFTTACQSPKPDALIVCSKCGFSSKFMDSDLSEPLPVFQHRHHCRRCQKTYTIASDRGNDPLRCVCGDEIMIPKSTRYYLRHIYRILAFWFWTYFILGLIRGCSWVADY